MPEQHSAMAMNLLTHHTRAGSMLMHATASMALLVENSLCPPTLPSVAQQCILRHHAVLAGGWS